MKDFVLSRQHGQGLPEYALLIAAVALTVVGILSLLGVRVDNMFCQVAKGIGSDAVCSTLLLFDDFSDGFDNWRSLTNDDKRWRTTNGNDPELCYRGRGDGQLLANDSAGADYTVSVDANITGGNGYGIYFRTSENENGKIEGYTFQYDPGYKGGQFIMRKWVNGYELWPPFAASAAPPGYRWHNVERHVEVTAVGDRFVATVDGEEVLVGQDDSYAAGSTGLRIWNSGRACFDNFTVALP